MKTFGNIIWLVCGGFMIAIEYFIAGLLMMLTIIGIPFGLQAFKVGIMTLFPFGSKVESIEGASGCLSLVMNVVWLILGGFVIMLTHLFWGIILCVLIVTIPFGKQHFKLMCLAFAPFGKRITNIHT